MSRALSPCSLVIMHGSDIGRPWRARAFRKPSRPAKRAGLRQPASIRCSFAIVTNGFVIDAGKVGGTIRQTGDRRPRSGSSALRCGEGFLRPLRRGDDEGVHAAREKLLAFPLLQFGVLFCT